jgi:hypothetical protein
MNVVGVIKHFFAADRFDHAVDTTHAAAYLNVSTKTILRWRRLGLLPATPMPSPIRGKTMWRYKIHDLHALAQQNINRVFVWNSACEQLPTALVAKLLDIETGTVHCQKSCGALSDYSPKSIRKYWRRVLTKEIGSEFKRKLSRLREENRRLRRLMKDGCHCRHSEHGDKPGAEE